jgi:hypothetical protein
MSIENQIEIPADEMGTSGYSKLAWKIWDETKLPMAFCVWIDQIVRSEGYGKPRKGTWTFNRDGSGTCSECHFTQRGVYDQDHHQHFCGVCGADMR